MDSSTSRMLTCPWREEEDCGQKAFCESRTLLTSYYTVRTCTVWGLSSNLNDQEEILL